MTPGPDIATALSAALDEAFDSNGTAVSAFATVLAIDAETLEDFSASRRVHRDTEGNSRVAPFDRKFAMELSIARFTKQH